ncbi:hypothetical protein lbkm_2579 [Lachnospiraceae bacterium KM106-2]|nr:hypothetical protein lbkm_2579 [Lachnospiraceae bacterium KM106-2]
MIWGTYLLLIPLAAIVFIIGIMSYFNKFGVEHYGFDLIEKVRDSEEEAKRQKKRNKIWGIIFMVFSIVILIIPVIFQ